MIVVDRYSREPIYEQIMHAIEQEILNGFLSEGELIPSVRNLSVELSINPNTIQKAYNELERMHITYSVPGVGRYVAKDAAAVIRKSREGAEELLHKAVQDLKVAGYSMKSIIERIKEYYGGGEND